MNVRTIKPPRHQQGGWVDPKKLPKDPVTGRPLCRYCSEPIPIGRRRTFCSELCVEHWVVRTGSGMVRLVRKRDKGICKLCGLDCEALRKQFIKLPKDGRQLLLKKYSIPSHRKRFWDVDHIVPVVEGGGSVGLDGLRTLCIPCHLRVTRELRARMSGSNKS